MKTFVAFAALALVAGAGAASAENVRIVNGHTVESFTVNTDDLKNEAGAQSVYSRLRDVVARVCEADGDAPEWVLEQDRQCMDEAMDGALADLHSEPLRQVVAAEGREAKTYARGDR